MNKKNADRDNVTYRELISEIRALRDENRQQLVEIKECLGSKVDVSDFVVVKERTNRMWDERNKFVGWALGAGVAGGGAAAVINSIISRLTEII